jgi:DNA-binding protein HU-beta
VNKSELVDAVHSAAGGVDKKDVAHVVDSLIEVVQSAVSRGDKVTVPGFGAW